MNVLIDFPMYQFLKITDEEKQNNVITKLILDATGVKINDPKRRVRISEITFVAKKSKLEFLDDYKDINVIYPDLTGLVDEEQQEKFKSMTFALYNWTYLQDPDVRAKINIPSREIIF